MRCTFTLLLLFFGFASSAQIITEIMYNSPETGIDSLEYIEIYNNTGQDIQLEGYQFVGVLHVFEPYVLQADEYLVVAKNKVAFEGVFQTTAIEWSNGSLNNSGEEVSFLNPDSTKISTVRYENGGEWPDNPNGLGYSLELCSLTANISDPANWGFSTFDTGMIIANRTVFGTPNRANEPDCSDSQQGLQRIAINEIMYNATGQTDSLEYIEMYNYGNDTISLQGWTIDGDITGNLPSINLLPRGTVVLCKNKNAFELAFGTVGYSWPGTQRLGDDGGNIRLFNGSGLLVEDVTYQVNDPWPVVSAGTAITRCDIFADPNQGTSWTAAETINDVPGVAVFYGSPGRINKCGSLSIGELTTNDSEGNLLMLGDTVTLTGTVHSPNYNSNGLQFVVIDDQNNGINVFTFDSNLGYEVTEGDNLTIIGELGQFNGLAQIIPSAIILNAAGVELYAPTEVFRPSEETESQLITIKDVYLLDSDEWTNQGSGFNVDISNGVDTIAMRIDADITSIYGLNYPEGTFDVTGIGGQFDNSSPYDSGYQILPRYFEDIDPYTEFMQDTTMMEEPYPVRTIAEMTNNNSEGVADSLGVACTMTGIVHGVNYSSADLIMTIIDADNNGIGVFNNDNTVGYIVQEGDEVTLKGTIGQFNGLTQISVDSLEILSIGNDLVSPFGYDILDGQNILEENESSLIELSEVIFLDPSQWVGDGSSFNVDVASAFDQTLGTYTVRIDNDTELASMPYIGDGVWTITGLQGQFDSSSPFDSGYQLLPRYLDDFVLLVNVIDTEFDASINIYPNPTSNILQVQSQIEIENYKIYNALGKVVKSSSFENQITIANLPEGSYSILFNSGDKLSTKKFIKIK